MDRVIVPRPMDVRLEVQRGVLGERVSRTVDERNGVGEGGGTGVRFQGVWSLVFLSPF